MKRLLAGIAGIALLLAVGGETEAPVRLWLPLVAGPPEQVWRVPLPPELAPWNGAVPDMVMNSDGSVCVSVVGSVNGRFGQYVVRIENNRPTLLPLPFVPSARGQIATLGTQRWLIAWNGAQELVAVALPACAP